MPEGTLVDVAGGGDVVLIILVIFRVVVIGAFVVLDIAVAVEGHVVEGAAGVVVRATEQGTSPDEGFGDTVLLVSIGEDAVVDQVPPGFGVASEHLAEA